MEGLLEKIEQGEGATGTSTLLEQMPDNIGGQTICALGDAAAMPVQSFVKKFRAEFDRHIDGAALPARRDGVGEDAGHPRGARRRHRAVLKHERSRRAVYVFWIFAIPLLASARSASSWSRNPVNAAMSLVAAFFFLAGIYVLLTAHLLAFLQVLVYAGAIMVLFLFVIMLLTTRRRELLARRRERRCRSPGYSARPA